MKKSFSLLLATAAFIMSCNQDKPAATEEKKDSTVAETKKVDNTVYPYKAYYSSSFEIGKPEYSKIVLDIWKAYEENKLDDTKNYWADSVTLEFDGYTFHGKGDSALKEAKVERAKYTSVFDSVAVWIPLHSVDKDADWVGIWAMETTVDKKGKKDVADVHEVWNFKNGKVVYISQFRAHRKP
ncbi:MAG: nuclear transport factor 2 family protein [Bacteroidetes bacterium]|nr:nuclear transport factor 2 family protein [Bacteroidota bacterium]